MGPSKKSKTQNHCLTNAHIMLSLASHMFFCYINITTHNLTRYAKYVRSLCADKEYSFTAQYCNPSRCDLSLMKFSAFFKKKKEKEKSNITASNLLAIFFFFWITNLLAMLIKLEMQCNSFGS